MPDLYTLQVWLSCIDFNGLEEESTSKAVGEKMEIFFCLFILSIYYIAIS